MAADGPRWLYHLVERSLAPTEGRDYAPPSLALEGFIHASYRDAVRESARLYFAPDASLVVLRIDPRSVGIPLVVATTPRGPMPHLHGVLRAEAIVERLELDEVDGGPDVIVEAT